MRKLDSDTIMEVVSRFYHITVEDMKSNRRNKEISNPRQIAMYLCRVLLNMTLPQIGQEFGNRDHTTVIHACNKITNDLTKSDALNRDVEEIKKRLVS